MVLRLAAATVLGLLSQPVLATTAPPSSAVSSEFNASRVAAVRDSWGALRAAIDDFDLVPSVAVSVGDERGELFRHAKGETDFDTQMPIASATKWVSGVCIMRAVEEGFLSLDDLASTHLTYWTVDPDDARSRVTLRHLLSFASGMSGSTSCPAELDFNECVRDMYTRSSSQWEPG